MNNLTHFHCNSPRNYTDTPDSDQPPSKKIVPLCHVVALSPQLRSIVVDMMPTDNEAGLVLLTKAVSGCAKARNFGLLSLRVPKSQEVQVATSLFYSSSVSLKVLRLALRVRCGPRKVSPPSRSTASPWALEVIPKQQRTFHPKQQRTLRPALTEWKIGGDFEVDLKDVIGMLEKCPGFVNLSLPQLQSQTGDDKMAECTVESRPSIWNPEQWRKEHLPRTESSMIVAMTHILQMQTVESFRY